MDTHIHVYKHTDTYKSLHIDIHTLSPLPDLAIPTTNHLHNRINLPFPSLPPISTHPTHHYPTHPQLKEKTMDELDEYVMLLETHRIKLVAKLKAVFDRFDRDKEGRLNGACVEQALVYMNRPVDSVQVKEWLDRLKTDRDTPSGYLEFPEFVCQYTALFAGEDPDVPAGERAPRGRYTLSIYPINTACNVLSITSLVVNIQHWMTW